MRPENSPTASPEQALAVPEHHGVSEEVEPPDQVFRMKDYAVASWLIIEGGGGIPPGGLRD
jgi:hypothetical protein